MGSMLLARATLFPAPRTLLADAEKLYLGVAVHFVEQSLALIAFLR